VDGAESLKAIAVHLRLFSCVLVWVRASFSMDVAVVWLGGSFGPQYALNLGEFLKAFFDR